MKATKLKLLYFSIPVLLLAASVFALNAGPLLKRPLGAGDDVPAKLSAISTLAAAGHWEQAASAAAELQAAWSSVRRRVQLVASRNELQYISLSLADMQGAVAVRDPVQFRLAEQRLRALWEALGR
jgi:hypothetical protein